MTHTNYYTNRWLGTRRAVALPGLPLALVLATMLAAASPARAADSYQVYMSSDYTLLMNPMSMAVHSAVQQQSSSLANTANNNPVIDIQNTSSTASIKEVQFTLTDPDTIFDALSILKGPTDAQKRFGTTGPFATTIWGGKSKTIDIVLPTPLAPNQNLVFFVNLAPLTGNPSASWIPGYTNIFFQDPPNMNANFKVFFNDNTTLNNVLPSLEDMQTNTSTDPAAFVLASSCCNTPSTMFLTGNFDGPPVPEPTSVMLVVLGSAPLAIPAWRRYRRSGRMSSES
jgi:hypothetical protein